MFTGIVTDIGRLRSVETHGAGVRRLTIETAFPVEEVALGASIACSGVCMTVVATGRDGGQGWFAVDAAIETLRITTVARWQAGERINLERALKIGDELGGHIVTGHVDALAEIVLREDLPPDPTSPWAATVKFVLRVPPTIKQFIAAKGSVCLDGTSLTVNTVEDDLFSVQLIPHTLQVTTWGARKAGDSLNIEVDMMARYAARLMEARG